MPNNEKIDCCFLVASSSKKSYQKLSETYSAIEPPTWALLLAQSTRAVGFNVKIIENLSEDCLNATASFAQKLQDKARICLGVIGASSIIWEYNTRMPLNACERFDNMDNKYVIFSPRLVFPV